MMPKLSRQTCELESLLNTDTKIFAKILAERLKKVCQEVIGPEQLAYIEGRVLQDGHMVMDKVLNMARKKKTSGLIATIDFAGAFDRIRHQCVWDTLEHMNVGDNLISNFKTLYRGAKSAVLNFGYQTNWLDLEKSAS